MNPRRRQTMTFLIVYGLLQLFVGGGVLLWWELTGISPTAAHDMISPTLWEAFAAVPWVFMLVTNLLSFLAGWFGAHFFSQASSVYDAMRRGE